MKKKGYWVDFFYRPKSFLCRFYTHNRFSVNEKQTSKERATVKNCSWSFPSDFDQFSIPQDIIETEKPEFWQTFYLYTEFPFTLFFLSSFLYALWIFLIALLTLVWENIEIHWKGRHVKGFRPESERGPEIKPKIKELTEH